MEKKYRGLRIIGLLLKIIGVFELVVGVAGLFMLPLVLSDSKGISPELGAYNISPFSSLVMGIISGFLVFLIGLVCGLLTFSAGELFNVVIAIEENTRASMLLLQEQKRNNSIAP
jgi:hypothetical protein